MKIKIFCVLFLTVLINVSFGSFYLSEREKVSWYNRSVLETPKTHLFTNEDVIELVYCIVPEKYVASFLYYSKMDYDYQTAIFRVYLLGLGSFESGWVKTRSNKANNNGTYDWGYLMLNERNIASHSFMKVYGPGNDYPHSDKLELYLIACIQYFKDLYLKYGCDSLYAYNAGERSYVLNKIPDSTYIYKYMVKKHIANISKMLYELAYTNRLIRENAYRERQIQFLSSEIERMATSLRTINTESLNGRDIDILGKRRYTHTINYDPKKKFITSINLRRIIFISRENEGALGNALQNV
jgi:hypothetical protein